MTFMLPYSMIGITTPDFSQDAGVFGLLGSLGSKQCEPSMRFQPWLPPFWTSFTLSHLFCPTSAANNLPPSNDIRQTFRKPYAQISGSASLRPTNGLSL